MEQASGVSLEALKRFAIDGELVHIEELKRGHINRTYVGTWSFKGERRRYVHQVVNHRIFTDIKGLMSNLAIVLDSVHAAIERGQGRLGDVTLGIVPTVDGESYVQDSKGEYWRTMPFIEKTASFDVCPSTHVAEEAGAILGRFQRSLLSVDPHQLTETIPHFLNSEKRFSALREAISADRFSRTGECAKEIDFALSLEVEGRSLNDGLESGRFPLRVSHNDMKLNNVLFDETGTRAICILDLDTCMAGTVLYDFGDLVRNTAVPCAEDEQDFSQVRVDCELYRSICGGYLREAGSILTQLELEHLARAPRVLALILGVRFLSDYLSGDTYFRTHRRAHNLERARTQFEIVRAFARAEEELQAISASV